MQASTTKTARIPLAIVGIGCRFPGQVADPETLWRLLGEGVDAVTEIPPERWRIERFYHADASVPGKTYARDAGFLDQSPFDFDAAFFGLSNREAAVLDPQQRLLLEVAWEAFEDAGQDCFALRGRRVGVFVGGFSLDNLIDRFSITGRDHISPSTATSSTLAMLSNRLSYAFDFRGPSLSIDTACSSSLVATHLACASLWSGESEIAIAGGVNMLLAPEPFMAMAKGGFLSRAGRCQAFDAAADGYVRAEGAGIVVLKPLAAALEAGDRIYALIRATGLNQDGATPGISMPNPKSQQALIRQVLGEAGLAPRDIAYAEAHGTGTQAGDPIEANSLGAELGAGRPSASPLLVGSIKTNIGHTEAAAGVAGLIKAALVLFHRDVPPNLHFRQPNPRIDFESLGIAIPTRAQPLPPEGPLFAAVNSFGYGGANAHAVLGSAPAAETAEAGEPESEEADRFFPLSASDEAALGAYAASLAQAAGALPLRDVGFTLCRRRSHHPVRTAIWARSSEDLARQLRDLRQAQSEGEVRFGRAPDRPRRLLFVYTGMGAQYRGMGRQLFREEPVFRAAVERCMLLARPFGDTSLAEAFGGTGPGAHGEPVGAPMAAQLPNLALQVGLTELWRSLGVEPEGIVGHSVGEIGAAWAAGALTLEEAVRLACRRGQVFQKIAGQGSMLALGLGRNEAEALLACRGDGLSTATFLAPDSTVVAGPGEALDRLAAELTREEVFQRRLHVDVAYHHAQFEEIEAELAAAFGPVAHEAPALPLYSTLEGGRIEGARHGLDYWLRNGRHPADFERAVTAALQDGFDALVEIGPARVMGAAIRSCASAAGRPVWTGASLIRGEAETPRIRALLSEMYGQGVPIRWEAHHHAGGRYARLPGYPWQRTRLWVEAPETRAARELDPADPLLQQRVANPSPAWETDLGSSPLAYLGDHVVGGAALFPAAGHVAALLAASRALERGNSLEGLRLDRALALTPTTRLRIDIAEDSGAAIVRSRMGPAAEWQQQAAGRLGLSRSRRRGRIDLGARLRAARRHLDAAAFYALLAERGLAYGPAFRSVREIWLGEGEVTARLELPEGAPPAGTLHPVLLDGAFQALAGLASAAAEKRGPLVPVSIEEVRLHGTIETAAHVVGRLIEEIPNSLTAALALCNADGEILAEIEGLRCQRLPVAEADRLIQAHFRDTWETAPVPHLERSAGQRWLLLDGGHSCAAALAAELRGHGHGVAEGGLAAFARLAAAAPPDGVAWFAHAPETGDAGLEATARLLRLVQDLARLPAPRPRLAVVTRDATGSTARPDEAAVWGLGRVAAAEHPDLRLLLVDCADDERIPLWLARELLGDALDREVRLDAEGRKVARLGPWSAPQPEAEPVEVERVAVALRQRRAGSQDSLEWHEFALPDPGPGEIEVLSQAASINFKDVLKSMSMLSGAYLERTFFGDNLGMETTGVVTRIGEGVTDFAPGDEVVYLFPNFASRQVLPARFAAKRPAQLSATDAPVFINYMTAYYGLVEIGRLRAGERVLIHLASGGVGQAAVALARMVGAEIVATAGDEEKRAFLRRQGIAHVFDSRSLDFADRIMEVTQGVGVDVVLNSLPGEALRRSWDVLAPYGRFIEIGKRDIEEDSALRMRRFDENRLFAAIDVDRLVRERPAVFRRIFADVETLFAEGRIGKLPVTVFPAPEVAEAFRLMSRARHIGKVVIDFRGQRVPALRLRPPRFRPDRTYLVTGAFGGFGQALARWMAREGARHLVLAGRHGAETPAARELVAEIGARAERLDVSDGEAVRDLLEEIRRGPFPLGGVFHAAMVLDDGLIASYEAGRLARVMAPKAQGALHLHRHSAGDPLDHFVLFSSVSQMIGNPGQGSYCAANAYLDGLARHRRAQGLPGLSVAWGVLGDAGVAARAEGLVAQLEKLGIRAFTTADALAALGPIMDGGPPNVAFADVDWERWAAASEVSGTPRFSLLVHASAASDRVSALRRELAALPPAMRSSRLEEVIKAALGAVLRTTPDKIPSDRPLDRLGVDSLMAVELTLGLEQEIGIKLPTALLMQGPSVGTLAAHLLHELLAIDRLEEAAVEDLSEAETDAMLEMLIASGELDLEAV